MPKCLKVILKVMGAAVLLFAALFGVYFFNLDMKLTAKLQPLLEMYYDKMDEKRNRTL